MIWLCGVVEATKKSVQHLNNYSEIDKFNAMMHEKDLVKKARIDSKHAKSNPMLHDDLTRLHDDF